MATITGPVPASVSEKCAQKSVGGGGLVLVVSAIQAASGSQAAEAAWVTVPHEKNGRRGPILLMADRGSGLGPRRGADLGPAHGAATCPAAQPHSPDRGGAPPVWRRRSHQSRPYEP
jgi:hypothetical protein